MATVTTLFSEWKDFVQHVSFCADNENDTVSIHGLRGSSFSFFLDFFSKRQRLMEISRSQYAGKKSENPVDMMVVVQSQKDAEELESDLTTVFDDMAEIHIFPWWENVVYRNASRGSASFGGRTGFLSRLCFANTSGKQRIFIVPQRSFQTPVPPPDYVKKLALKLRKGQSIDPQKLAEKLSEYGFTRVPKVNVKGEFALRGEVLDVFLSGETEGIRIVFDFDEIRQIKTFDPENQSSRENFDEVVIYPMKEVVWTSDLVDRAESVIEEMAENGIQNDYAEFDRKRSDYSGGQKDSVVEGGKLESSASLALTETAYRDGQRIIRELRDFGESEGEENFYPVLWDRIYTVMDYIRDEVPVFYMDFDRLSNAQKMLENEYAVSYRQTRLSSCILPPEKILLDFSGLKERHQRNFLLRNLETQEEIREAGQKIITFEIEPSQSYFGNFKYLKEQLQEFQHQGYWIYVYADNENQSLRIKEILREFIEPEDEKVHPLSVLNTPITEGFSVPQAKMIIIQENEIFGRKRKIPKSIRTARSKPIDTFIELNPGDYVVHVQYGIGLFDGIQRVKTSLTERYYIKLEYADKEIVFIPIEQVNMVQLYIGKDGSKPKLDKLGSKNWNSRKAKVQQKVQEIAEKLIDLYSKRSASKGFAFPKDGEWQTAFEAAFPYEDTPDQFQATLDIKEDMEKSVPMDRLVCGDVGYGKTEIAMRAAFKAVMGGKQVAFLAPTTILAEQHFENCVERFKNFPVSIAHMSRFVTPAKQKEILAKVAEGQVDILIGTHRIIQKDVKFKDLGLMIIDEEQRFGVQDKEKLKVLKNNIDSLAMSATPIPRTLHMSLLKIRDMSLLPTPPQNRLPVETFVEEYNEEKLVRAIRMEVERGGQVFYLHNRVESLDEVRLKLERLMPELLIETAHGQMTSDELDDIFRRFRSGAFHVLVATTIIENGIDIPSVNTIIIDRADMYGISQLYQLRGRVGRSDKKAYAYLFYPEKKVLSEIAMKRLTTISDFTELGSGFKIAMKDLEIRGAGNLLGTDQSGEVYAVGFEMYLNLLNNAIERLLNSDWNDQSDTVMELEYSGFIPESYIKSPQIKMEMYKKFAGIKTQNEYDSILNELNDRFGPIPDEVMNLLNIAKIRIFCSRLCISSLKDKKGVIRIEFGKVAKLNIDKIMSLVRLSAGKVKIDSQSPNTLILNTGSLTLEQKAMFIIEKLEALV